MPRKWSSQYYSKFCAFPEFIPFQMNLPSEDTIVNKAGGISFEHYCDSAPAGPVGQVFVNPHFVHKKSTAFDFSYNSAEGKYNFQGKLELQKNQMMAKLNVEEDLGGYPVAFLLGADVPVDAPQSTKAVELAVRTAKGKAQVGVRAKLGFQGALWNSTPKIECVYALSSKVKAGVHVQLNDALNGLSAYEGRVHAREAGVLGCLKLDGVKQTALATVQLPKQEVAGHGVTITGQAEMSAAGVKDAKIVAEVGVKKNLNLKLKGEMSGQATASVIFGGLAGGYDLTLGVTRTAGGKAQFGALLQHGYYSFMGW
eukprot:TRINITY_DN3908_c1_g1_i1.p2 TRINITY_DN3908_c1_g1~~TRINITY_DN3908_c1_g1_i1.p2  ORF type:complete len:312 (+),score=124.86 TRINITY_DN3908_c1_g1_i1:82-1017(+)